jgi:hypothetical protein
MSEFNDFLKLIADGKKTDPVAVKAKEFEATIKESVKADLGSLFSELSSLKQKKAELIEEHPQLAEEVEPIVEEVITEVAPLPTPVGKVPKETQLPDIDKYMKSMPETPKADPLTNEFKQVNDKIKFLERWIGQIQNAGPGSGEVNFRYLDDTNRSTMNPENDNWVLEYDVATKKVQFTNEIGPIKTVKFDTTNSETPVMGGINWNSMDATMNIGMDYGVVQQVGEESYIRVTNSTGAMIPNGSTVGYVTASINTAIEVQPYIANGTHITTDFIGVMTHDLPDSGQRGYATATGLVRDLNTSMFDIGDVLYASATVAGGITNVKPTAPNNVITIGYVAKVGVTDGIIFVRPVLEAQMYYGTFARITDYTPAVANTAYAVPFDNTRIANGITIGTPTTRIVVPQSGFYDISATIQYASTNSSAKDIYSWIRANGVDVPESTRIVSLAGSATYNPILISETVSLAKDAYIEIMIATTDASVSAKAVPATSFSPQSPAVNLVITQVQQ